MTASHPYLKGASKSRVDAAILEEELAEGFRKYKIGEKKSFLAKIVEFFKKLLVGSLLLYSHRAQNHELRPVSQSCEGIYNLIYGLPLDRSAAVRAESPAGMGKEHAEIIMDFRHCAYSGPGIMAGGFLVNGNGRRKAGYLIHIGLVHLSQKLPGIGRQGLHILSLPFCINRIKGKR